MATPAYVPPVRGGNPYHPQPVTHFDWLGSSFRYPGFDTAYDAYQTALHGGGLLGGGVKGYHQPSAAAVHAAALALADAGKNLTGQWYDAHGHTIGPPPAQVVTHEGPQYIPPPYGQGGMAHGPPLPAPAAVVPDPTLPVGPHPGPGWGIVPPGGFPPGVEPAPHWNPIGGTTNPNIGPHYVNSTYPAPSLGAHGMVDPDMFPLDYYLHRHHGY
jgi:hypothetical protein